MKWSENRLSFGDCSPNCASLSISTVGTAFLFLRVDILNMWPTNCSNFPGDLDSFFFYAHFLLYRDFCCSGTDAPFTDRAG